jgi:hypothetical protein
MYFSEPFASNPNARTMWAIIGLEQTNLVIENVALGVLAPPALSNIPGIEVAPPGIDWTSETGAAFLQVVRSSNNSQINLPLGQAGSYVPQ